MKQNENLERKAGVCIKRGIYAKYVKRLLDIAFSLFGIVVFLPIWLILAALIRIKLGKPIFFIQTRTGKNEKPFKMIKFRTMTDARDENGELLPDTKRFTRFGNFLRNTSLDEIPELINVVLGQMSLVGPRPLYTFYLPFYTDKEALRHTVRGGITGLAQVNGRNSIGWEDRLNYDVKYVEHITFVGDVKIIFKTIGKVFKKEDIGIPSVDEPLALHLSRKIQRPDMMQEIGSAFSLDRKNVKEDHNIPQFIDRGGYQISRLYSTCRSAIREILNNINNSDKDVALVPPFTCESVTDPFFEKKYRVITYPILKNFQLDEKTFINLLLNEKPRVLLFHEYFGFHTAYRLEDICKQVVSWDMKIICDETQTMFSKRLFVRGWPDFRIGSIRKWGPIPDGAYLLAKYGTYSMPADTDEEFINAELDAMDIKQRYLCGENVSKQVFLKKFSEDISYIDNQKTIYAMSSNSKYIVNNINWNLVVSSRRDNYMTLLNGLSKFQFITIPFAHLDDGVVPFYFPIFIKEKRADFQKYLADNRIYATIIWSCPKELSPLVSNTEKEIYDEILCIPCDQRYDSIDMKRIVEVIENYTKK